MNINDILLHTLCEKIAVQETKIQELDKLLNEKENFLEFVINQNKELKEENENLKREMEKQ